jgi:futalosine hydrolase
LRASVKPVFPDLYAMRILLCAATSFEIGPTTGFLREQGLEDLVDVLLTGVGLLAATHALTKQVLSRRPDFILQGGIAGTFDEKLPPGETIAVTADTVADLGVQEGGQFRTISDLGLQATNGGPWQGDWLVNPHRDVIARTGLQTGRGITINEISTDPARMAFYTERFGAKVESMEGAALHYVGLQEGIPFLQLRAISNLVGERDKNKWRIADSIASLDQALRQFIRKTLDI